MGELAGRADHNDIVDVTVAEGAVRRGDNVIVTSHEDHIRKVVRAVGAQLRIENIRRSGANVRACYEPCRRGLDPPRLICRSAHDNSETAIARASGSDGDGQ